MRITTIGRLVPIVVLGLLLPLLLAPGSGAVNGSAVTTSPVAGRVVDATGAPVAAVEVWAAQLRTTGAWKTLEGTVTSADGRYAMDLEPGTYRLLFEPPTAASLAAEYWGGAYYFLFAPEAQDEPASFVLAEGTPASDKDVVLDATGTVTGSVVSTDPTVVSGAGAEAYRKVDGEWVRAWGSTSGADPTPGRFRIQRIPPGTYRIKLTGGNGFISRFWPDVTTVDAAVDVVISPGGVVNDINARLDPLGQIAGRLVDAAGRGVADFGVEAEALVPNVGRYEVETKTNARGYYFLNALPGARYTLRFDGPLGHHCDEDFYHVQDGATVPDELVIPASTTTTVTIQTQTQELDCRLRPIEEPETFGFDPAFVGQPVGIVPPEWTYPDAEVTYQWYGLGVGAIPGATEWWHVPTYPYSILHLDVIATRPGVEPVRLTFQTPVYPGAIRSKVFPRIKGDPRVGETLRVTRGEWNAPEVLMEFTWMAGTRPIRGAHGTTLQLTRRQVGKRIWVKFKVYTKDGSYMPREFETKPTKPVTRR